MKQQGPRTTFFPREHGATAMLLTPFVAAAILARTFRWQEVAGLLAIAGAYSIKEPLVTLGRRRIQWEGLPLRNWPAELRTAALWLLLESIVASASALALLLTGPWLPYAIIFAVSAAFFAFAFWINLRNRQRNPLFQVASALALTSTSLVAALSATGSFPAWTWLLWALLAAQATGGIFTVHARLDAMAALRKSNPALALPARRTAISVCILLFTSAIVALVRQQPALAVALDVITVGYAWDLRRQRDPAALKLPFMKVGQRSLALALVYSVIVLIGLW